MREGFLIVNHFLTGGAFAGMESMLRDAASRAGVSLALRTNAMLCALPGGRLLSGERAPAFALFFDKDVRLAQLLERMGVRLFNSARAIAACDDKTLTHIALAGLPAPETILCPQTFPGVGYGDMQFLENVADTLGFPMVVKEGCGSFGRQVYLVSNMAELRALVAKLGATPLLFQRFIKECAGRDIRAYVVGGRVIAAIERRSESGDFRANLSGGGTARKHALTREEEALAIQACERLSLDFGGVDLLPSDQGALICEVNSNAHFIGLARVTGANPADAIMEHIRKVMQ